MASGWQVVFPISEKCGNCLSILSISGFQPLPVQTGSRGAPALESEPVEH